MPYTIQIDEEQRLALLEVLRAAPLSLTGVAGAPLELWVEMLDGLPTAEAADPGLTHGFCL